MEGKILFMVRLFLVLGIGYFLMIINGITGVIDVLQITEVFLGMFILAITIRKFCERGLFYIAEYTALIAGLVFMLVNMLQIWIRYGLFNLQILSISMISLFYGIGFSLFNTAMIWNHKKNLQKKREVKYE